MGSEMELVRQFNSELSSIYEGKPPISKAKMAAITRFAVKALKYYKHVVHSVEKFIQKCHNEYKLPALYVLDSIIRQSRHQFGSDKDLFGPRFQKNIKLLFLYIYQCPSEDKPKVVRVLNLWQKNGIYTPDVISPIIDMASTSSKSLTASIQKHKKSKSASERRNTVEEANDDGVGDFAGFDDNDLPKSSKKRSKGVRVSQEDEIKVLKAQLEQQRKQQELLQQQLQMQMMQTKQQSLQLQLQQQQMQSKIHEQILSGGGGANTQAPPADPNLNLITQIQELQKQLERDKVELTNLTQNSEDEPQQQQQQQQQPPSATDANNPIKSQSQFLENFQQLIQSAKGMVNSKDPRQQGAEENKSPQFNQALLEGFDYDDEHEPVKEHQQPTKAHSSSDERGYHHHDNSQYEEKIAALPSQPMDQQQPPLSTYEKQQKHGGFNNNNNSAVNQGEFHRGRSWDNEPQNMQIDNDDMQIDNENDYHPEFHQEDPRIQHQQQGGGSGGESGQGGGDGGQVDSEEQKRREKELERKQKDKRTLPQAPACHMTVASITLWVGRLPKSFDPNVLARHFNEYGNVEHIEHIESRGCAFVTMASRFDADSALKYLKRRRIDGHDVKINWARTKILHDYSRFWDENSGCVFIPWNLVNSSQIGSFISDGCFVDEDTLPPGCSMPTPTKDEQEAGGSTPTQDGLSAPPAPPGFLPGMPPGIFPPGMVPPIPPPPVFRGRLPPPMPPGILPPGIPGLQFNIQRPLQMPGQMPPEQVPPEQMHHHRQQQNHHQQQHQQHGQPPPRGPLDDSPNFNVDNRPAFNQIPPRFPINDRPIGVFPHQRPPPNEHVRPNFEPRGMNDGGVRFRPPFIGASEFPESMRQNERGREPLAMSQPPQQLRLLENQNNAVLTRPPLRSPRPQLQAQAFLAMQCIPPLGATTRHQNPVVERPPWQDPKTINNNINPATALLLGLVNKQKESDAEVHQAPHTTKKDDQDHEGNRVEEREQTYRRDRSSSREDRDKRNRSDRRDRSRDRRDRDRDRDDRRERSDWRDKGDRYGDRGRRSRDSRDYRDSSRERREERDRRGGDREDRESRRVDKDRFGRDRFGRDRDEDRNSEKSRPRSRSRERSRSARGQQSENTEVMRKQETSFEKQLTINELSKVDQPENNTETSKEQSSQGEGGSELYDPLQSVSPDINTVVMEKEDGEVASEDTTEEESKGITEFQDESSPHDSPIFPIRNENEAIFADDVVGDDSQSSNDVQMGADDAGHASSNVEQAEEEDHVSLPSGIMEDTEKDDIPRSSTEELKENVVPCFSTEMEKANENEAPHSSSNIKEGKEDQQSDSDNLEKVTEDDVSPHVSDNVKVEAMKNDTRRSDDESQGSVDCNATENDASSESVVVGTEGTTQHSDNTERVDTEPL